jgi:flagellar basal body rod protein FlgG
VILGSTGTLSLPAQGLLTNVNQITSAIINRTGANADTAAIQETWDQWYGAELTYRQVAYEDAVSNAAAGKPARPWANMPSWQAYPVIQNYQPTGGQLPAPGSLAPSAQTAINAYLTYKELVTDIDIVSGNKAFTFENTGELSLPGTLVFKDAANAKIVLKTTDNYGYVLEPSEYDKAWTFNTNGDLTLPAGGDILDSNGSSVLGGGGANLQDIIVESPANMSDEGSGNFLNFNVNEEEWMRLGTLGNEKLQLITNYANEGGNVWEFGANGVLTVPSGMTIGDVGGGQGIYGNDNAAIGVAAQGSTGSAILQWVDSISSPTQTAGVIANSPLADPGSVQIVTGAVDLENQGIEHSWTFGANGSLQIPGDIKSEGNINIDINLEDSTLRRWQFGEDGNLTLPEAGDIVDINGYSVISGLMVITPENYQVQGVRTLAFAGAGVSVDRINDITTVTIEGGGDNSYTPEESDHWNSPTVNTVQAALDELAAKVAALENFEIDGGNAYTPAAGELLIDGNGA